MRTTDGEQTEAGAAVRKATEEDLARLAEIRNTPALFAEYLADAAAGKAFFLVYLRDRRIVAFARLKMPTSESVEAGKKRALISDLWVAEDARGRGTGTDFIHRIEGMARGLGYRDLYLGVDPCADSRAFALYRRLGYKAIQAQPYRTTGVFCDASGTGRVRKEYLRLDMVKDLSAPHPGDTAPD